MCTDRFDQLSTEESSIKRKTLRRVSIPAVAAVLIAGASLGSLAPIATAAVGQGFTVSASDLTFIMAQIKIAEHHAATSSVANPCGTLVGTGPDQIPSPLVSKGLRTVDGSCNNLVDGLAHNGSADQAFPRFAPSKFNDAEPLFADVDGPGPLVAGQPTSYKQKTPGNVVSDSGPRTVSNLIVDQTSRNPAAVAAAGAPVRTQGNTGVVVCATPAVQPCTPPGETLFIPNVTTDVGLSPPYNGLFTIFGQFFDHGVDQTTKGGGTVFVPLKADDPLIAGKDGIPGNADDPVAGDPRFVPPSQRFMALTRGTNLPGPDGVMGTADDVQDARNTDTPWVDQSQTYTSHGSHQTFLRQYVLNTAGRPVATGKLISSADGTAQANWSQVKAQAATLLGLHLVDRDVTDIPMLLTDEYGKFVPGPARGLPQYVTATGLVEGNTAGGGVLVPANVKHFDTPFLTDIAHNADPSPAQNGTVPTPDADSTASADFAAQPAGTYDDEMLNLHFICGDGRCNENIALTAIHQVFHSEHDRLVADIQNTINTSTDLSAVQKAEWHTALGAAGWNGERLFQAARFVTEMEYQHLVFEEFARKVQPAINPFEPFAFTQNELNPAVKAEFAHAVYRFGHSMLTEDIARTNNNGSTNDISLLDGFLNPPEFYNGGTAGTLNGNLAAGSIFMGMSDQTGNELDEFVTDTLRNNLLGLPLDLASLNMTRARSEGVPTLNMFRKSLFAGTNDGSLKPYTSWVDFGQNIKHPESLVNFVAAYGKHPTITSATTLAGKRAAAKAIVDPALGVALTADQIAFMNSSGAYADVAGASVTGLDDVDLWVGGLAEITTPFGGLLGTTFNYVFEQQLTELQNGDRLYYLARTPGMNLRAQLEGNSFAELVMRNTDAHSLKADAFATADCKFQLSNLAGTPAGFDAQGNTVTDDPSSECDEGAVLIRMADGTIQYRATNTVDPPGINGQSVYNGTAGVDRIYGGNDNDTFWGNENNDRIEGGGGADVALGGEGDDIITDIAGDDVPKGGPGNDALNGGPGLDILMGGDGKDFSLGGLNANETFGGAGDDFMDLGDSLDAGFGDSGDDWEEGGNQPDLMQGDSGNLFFLDDSQKQGNDVLIGQGGDDDYDMEGGDDIGVAGPGVEKVAGASGFDWEIGGASGQGDPTKQDMDLALPLVPLDILTAGVRDKFNEVEALSGGALNDTLRGDDIVPSDVGGGGFIGCDALDAAGIARINGLNAVVPSTILINKTAAQTPGNPCPLVGPIWGEGNVILGGDGSDTMEGRLADDIMDGDRAINVRISIRANDDGTGAEIGTTNGMSMPITGAATPLNGRVLSAAVFDGTVNPGQLVTVREVITAPAGASNDRAIINDTFAAAVFGAPDANGVTVVTSTDGVDRISNVEQLVFTDFTVTRTAGGSFVGGVLTVTPPPNSVVPGAPAIGTPVAGNAQVSVNWAAPAAQANSPAVTGYVVRTFVGAATTPIRTTTVGNVTSTVIATLTNGTGYTFDVAAVNIVGTGLASARSVTATPTVPPAPTVVTNPLNGARSVNGAANVTATFNVPVTGVTNGTMVLRLGTTVIPAVVTLNAAGTVATLNPNANLLNDRTYVLSLTSGITRATGGTALVPVTASFLTGPAPVITARTPAINAVGVDRDNNASVTFSEAVLGVTTGTVTITRVVGNVNVPYTLTAAGNTRTLNPTARLAANTQYRIALTGGTAAIRDLAGNPLVTTSWTFTTGAV